MTHHIARHTLFVPLLALFLVTSVKGAEIVGGTAEDRERMAEISAQWVDAYARGDLDGIMAIMHPDSVVMPHNQPTSRGKDEVRAYFGSRIGRPGVRFIDDLQEIRINGSWAVVQGRFAVEVTPETGGDPMVVHNGRYLVLYEKVDGDWLMLRDMDNLDPVDGE